MTAVCARRTVPLLQSTTVSRFSPCQTLTGSTTLEPPVWRRVLVRSLFLNYNIQQNILRSRHFHLTNILQALIIFFSYLSSRSNSHWSNLATLQFLLLWPFRQIRASCHLISIFQLKAFFAHGYKTNMTPFFREGACMFVWDVVSLPVDNYLAIDVACTLNYPKPNQDVIITQPCGNDTQKCEKCEGDCPKGKVFTRCCLLLNLCSKYRCIEYIIIWKWPSFGN